MEITLSQEAISLLEKVSRSWGKSPEQVIEHLILSRLRVENPIRCVRCGSILASVEDGGIKAKRGDYTVLVKTSGQVEIRATCRDCGAKNYYSLELGKVAKGYEIKVKYE